VLTADEALLLIICGYHNKHMVGHLLLLFVALAGSLTKAFDRIFGNNAIILGYQRRLLMRRKNTKITRIYNGPKPRSA